MTHWYLMRHAHPEPGSQMDAQRGITDKGKAQCKAMRHLLNDLGVNLDLILSSDFARAVETAERMQHGRDIPLQEIKELRPNQTPEDAWEAVDDFARSYGADHVLIVTHDPLIMPMLSAACISFSERNLFDHANIAHFDADGRFHWFAGSKLVKKLGLAESAVPALVDLTEHLLRASRRKMLGKLEIRMGRIVKRALKGGDRTEFRDRYREISKLAFDAGARLAQVQLGKVLEAKKRGGAPLPRLPDPVRTAELAAGEIDWADTNTDADRVKKIAEYEVSKAFHDGMRAMANYAVSVGGDIEKSWEIQPNACPICVANAEEGWIPEAAPFSSGDFTSPAHAHCQCSVAYRSAEVPYGVTGEYS